MNNVFLLDCAAHLKRMHSTLSSVHNSPCQNKTCQCEYFIFKLEQEAMRIFLDAQEIVSQTKENASPRLFESNYHWGEPIKNT